MKKLMLLAAFLFFSLQGLMAQKINQRMFDEKSSTDILIGNCTREGLMGVEFGNSYNEEYPGYNPKEDIIMALKEKMMGIKCTIVLGTWCGDSKEQVPRFLKILDLIGYPNDELTLIGVDRNKEAPEMKIKDQYLIEKVPTFIIYREDSEIGRIIETPKESLEKDLLEIVKPK
jgi:hypothetical protein